MLKKKITNVGFDAPTVAERRPFGLAALARYPIFPATFLDFMRTVVPRAQHDTLVFSLVITAQKPD